MSSKAKTGRINDVDTYYKVEPAHETPLIDILTLIYNNNNSNHNKSYKTNRMRAVN